MQRLDETCHPLEDMDDFIAALRIVDGHTTEDTLWEVFLPKMEDYLDVLVQDCKFREVLEEQPTVAIRLLAHIAADGQSPPEEDPLLGR
jgi:hypothetical protein